MESDATPTLLTETQLRGILAQLVATGLDARIHAQMDATLDELLRERLAAWVRDNELRARELSLMERVVRVEEELKAL